MDHRSLAKTVKAPSYLKPYFTAAVKAYRAGIDLSLLISSAKLNRFIQGDFVFFVIFDAGVHIVHRQDGLLKLVRKFRIPISVFYNFSKILLTRA